MIWQFGRRPQTRIKTNFSKKVLRFCYAFQIQNPGSLLYQGFRDLCDYSHSTITNQFCLEIICCRVPVSFDYLIYPYYPAYMN